MTKRYSSSNGAAQPLCRGRDRGGACRSRRGRNGALCSHPSRPSGPCPQHGPQSQRGTCLTLKQSRDHHRPSPAMPARSVLTERTRTHNVPVQEPDGYSPAIRCSGRARMLGERPVAYPLSASLPFFAKSGSVHAERLKQHGRRLPLLILEIETSTSRCHVPRVWVCLRFTGPIPTWPSGCIPARAPERWVAPPPGPPSGRRGRVVLATPRVARCRRWRCRRF